MSWRRSICSTMLNCAIDKTFFGNHITTNKRFVQIDKNIRTTVSSAVRLEILIPLPGCPCRKPALRLDERGRKCPPKLGSQETPLRDENVNPWDDGFIIAIRGSWSGPSTADCVRIRHGSGTSRGLYLHRTYGSIIRMFGRALGSFLGG